MTCPNQPSGRWVQPWKVPRRLLRPVVVDGDLGDVEVLGHALRTWRRSHPSETEAWAAAKAWS